MLCCGCRETSSAPDGGADLGVSAECPPAEALATATASELVVLGDPGAAQGIFDPSFVYPVDAPAGAMAYSAVPDQRTIRTRVALSADNGATWTFAAELNEPEAATLLSTDAGECPGGSCTGNLISEVSSLVYDADDPDPSRRWKLFAHRYLVGPNVELHYRMGTIALQTAAHAEGPWTAPQKLLGWRSPTAYSLDGVALDVSGVAATADCLALTEPGALWLPGSLSLAVGCVYLDGATPRIRIELFRSLDHALSWQWVGTPLRPADTNCLLPTTGINAAELFAHDGTVYVAATPSDTAGYHGCLIYPFADFASGQVARDVLGRAVVTRTLVPSPARFAGACSFAAGAGGLAMVVGFLGDARPFRIFRAGIVAP